MSICSERTRTVTATVVGCAVVLATVAHASAQSLGDVARAEEARRKTVTSAGKVYTNDRLRPDPTTRSQPATPPAAAASASPAPSSSTPKAGEGTKAGEGAPKAGEGPAKDGQPQAGAKDEAAWRSRIKAARESLDRSKVMADALQSRINGLNADFTARDDPAQRNLITADLQRALAELDRTKKDIEQQTKAIAQIQDEGRRAGVPAGWLR